MKNFAHLFRLFKDTFGSLVLWFEYRAPTVSIFLDHWFAVLNYKWSMVDRYLASHRGDNFEAAQCHNDALMWQGVLNKIQLYRTLLQPRK
jgi:hypothetical protein